MKEVNNSGADPPAAMKVAPAGGGVQETRGKEAEHQTKKQLN